MVYSVKETFLTLQGEGANTGRAAVFCRFSGCNLWTGRETDRAKAICQFCDTDFVGTDGDGGGKFAHADDLAMHIRGFWADTTSGDPLVVFTGGEPLLQLDTALIAALHGMGFTIAVETNGTVAAPEGIDWLCVSPKIGSDMIQMAGDELKFVYPQAGADPQQFAQLDFAHFFLQPIDHPDVPDAVQQCIDYCLAHPQWRLSLQTHKITGIR